MTFDKDYCTDYDEDYRSSPCMIGQSTTTRILVSYSRRHAIIVQWVNGSAMGLLRCAACNYCPLSEWHHGRAAVVLLLHSFHWLLLLIKFLNKDLQHRFTKVCAIFRSYCFQRAPLGALSCVIQVGNILPSFSLHFLPSLTLYSIFSSLNTG